MIKQSYLSLYETPNCEVAEYAVCSPLLENSFDSGIEDWSNTGVIVDF